MLRAAATFRVKEADALRVGLLESVTVTATVKLPVAEGVPLMAPVVEFSANPEASPVALHE